MQQLGQHIFTITAVSVICGMLLSLLREGTMHRLLRMICGIILTIMTISPLRAVSFSDFDLFPQSYLPEGKTIAAFGNDLAGEERRRCIQHQLEAYILDKANALDAAIRPVVELDDQDIPVEVRLYGTCTSAVRQTLTAVITNDLGIPEEDQKWTGEK